MNKVRLFDHYMIFYEGLIDNQCIWHDNSTKFDTSPNAKKCIVNLSKIRVPPSGPFSQIPTAIAIADSCFSVSYDNIKSKLV